VPILIHSPRLAGDRPPRRYPRPPWGRPSADLRPSRGPLSLFRVDNPIRGAGY
jgi:hypothetical protein